MNERELLAEALAYVGASEQEQHDMWPDIREWHRKVAALLNVECEEWAEDECESS